MCTASTAASKSGATSFAEYRYRVSRVDTFAIVFRVRQGSKKNDRLPCSMSRSNFFSHEKNRNVSFSRVVTTFFVTRFRSEPNLSMLNRILRSRMNANDKNTSISVTSFLMVINANKGHRRNVNHPIPK